MASNTHVTLWLSHDGYRDPDDNLSMLVGGAEAKASDRGDSRLSLGGFVFGDTKDGGQFYMVNPTGSAPKSFGSDARYGDKSGNKVAAGNYEFYKDYGKAAISNLGIGQYDLIAADKNGSRAWNFDANKVSQISSAAAALAADIKAAIAKPNEVVAYSAGGGANVAAEAIGLLLNQGYRKAVLIEHFAVIQHGRSNWEKQYEPEARSLTREFTIAISNQNMSKYANGSDGPGLKTAITNVSKIDGSAFGNAFDKALDVAIGKASYTQGLSGATFKATRDASDAGSHAFGADVGRLLAAWDRKMHVGDDLPSGDAWAHKIDGKGGDRLRVLYNDFDAKDVARLLDGSKSSTVKGAAAAADLDDGGPDTGPHAGPDTGPDTAPGPDAGPGVAAKAPFATTGASVTVGATTLYGFDADGGTAAIGVKGARIGVAAVDDSDTIDHAGGGSETIGLDFGAAIDAITLRLAGLGSKAGAHEGATLVAYDADGDVLDSWTFTRNGAVTVDFDEPVHYATLEAADWIGGGGPAHSDPDFALLGIGLDYV
jgi:hypothetical protein